MDGIVRRCWRQPLRATGYEASAEICSSAKQMLQPAVFLTFSPMSKPQPPVAVADVISIAAAAALPAPLTLRFRQRTRNSMDCFLSCILPGQPEALIGYCDANSVNTRGGMAWKIGCKYAHCGGGGGGGGRKSSQARGRIKTRVACVSFIAFWFFAAFYVQLDGGRTPPQEK
jgi:hypothetical protein